MEEEEEEEELVKLSIMIFRTVPPFKLVVYSTFQGT